MSNSTHRPVRLYAGRLVWNGELPKQTVNNILGHLRHPQQRGPASSVLDIPPVNGGGHIVVRCSAIDAIELLDEATTAEPVAQRVP